MTEIKRSLAVIIGINGYINGIPPLKTAVNDATKLAINLKENYQYTVYQLLDTQATYLTLTQLFVAFQSQTIPLLDGSTISVQPDDRLLFYFAGHGIAVDGIDNADGPAGFLVPQDAQLENQSSWIPMQQLHDALTALPCRHLLIVLDCCFAGSFRWAGHSRHAVRSQKVYRERYDRFVSGFAQQVITSAAHDEKAADSLYRFGQRQEGEMHSPFAELLLKALSGEADFTTDGVMTATELYLYLHSELGKTVAKQTPGICQLKRHDKGEFIFPVPGFDRSLLSEAPKLNENTNPYRGLESFDEQHSKLFFGRKVLVEKLLNVVVEHPLTVVMGASGSGKSSLVKAGLVPQLRNAVEAHPVGHPPTPPTPWRILAPIRPGEAPFIALNKMLSLENFPIVDFSHQISQDKNQGYEQQIKSLSQAVATWSQENPQTKLLIVIDQCEELVTLCQADEEKNQFLNLLASAIAAFPNQLRIILTLRSDFEPQFRDTALEPYWTAARFVVPAMRRDELRQVIEEPATTRVMYFEPPGLVNQLIDEVAQMPGALPLLSFSLSELYLKYIKSCQAGKRNDRAITQEDYEEIGGVTRSLTQRADCEYDELVKQNPVYTKTVRNVMLRMVAVGSGELARRQVMLSELEYPEPENGRVKEVIRRFSIARLVVGGQDTEGNLYVEPAHDVLVRGWQKLLSWKKQEQETLILQRRLTPAAQEWKSKQHQQYLWHNDPRLPLLKQVLRSPECWLNSLESEFVQRSIQRRRSNRLRIMSVAVGGVAVLFGALLDASGQRDIAQRSEKESQRQSITAFSNSSEAFYTSNHQLKALVNAVQAGIHFKTLNLGKTDQLYPTVMSALQQTVYGVRERNSLRGHGEGVLSVSFSPDGQLIATGSDDNTVKLWNREGKELLTFKGHQGAVNSVSFSPDGQTLATASADKTVRLWSLDGKRVQTLAGHSNAVMDVSFSPDGQTIASTSWDKTVKLWNQDGKELLTLQGHERGVDSVSFSPDGQTLATASWDKTVKLWNLEGQEQLTLQGHQSRVWSVSFSPDGQTIATASYDKTVKLWNRQGQELQTLQGHNSGVSSISFSPDGQTIASTSVDKTVKLWNRDGQELQTLRGHNSGVSSISFSPDGQMITSASWDKTVKLWNWNQKDQPTLRGHQEQVWSVSFSPDGQLIATASDDNTVKLWSREGKELQTLQGHEFGVTSVSFSPDGQLIATASDDNTVKLWSRDGKDLHTLRGHTFRLSSISIASDDNSIKLWNQEGKKLHILRGHRVGNSFGLLSVGVNSVSFSPDGQLIATGGNDKTVKLWSREGKELSTLRGHKNEVTSVSFSPDGQTIASASLDKTIKLWNRAGKLLQTLQGHQSGVYSVSFSPDNQLIATGSNDNTIKLWSREGKELQTLTKHTAGVNSVSFSPDSQLIASASADNTVKLWSREGKELLTLRGHGDKVLSVSFSPDGQTLASASLNNTVMLWNLQHLELDQLLARGCDSLHNYLNNPTADLTKEERNLCKNH